jgi:hypothetical protein
MRLHQLVYVPPALVSLAAPSRSGNESSSHADRIDRYSSALRALKGQPIRAPLLWGATAMGHAPHWEHVISTCSGNSFFMLKEQDADLRVPTIHDGSTTRWVENPSTSPDAAGVKSRRSVHMAAETATKSES